MKIWSSQAYAEWYALSEFDKERIKNEALLFVYDGCNEKEMDEDEPFEITYLHLISMHDSDKGLRKLIEQELWEVVDKLEDILSPATTGNETLKAIKHFHNVTTKIKEIIEEKVI